MSLTEEDVKKISKLAHLTLSDEEAKKYTSELASILGYIQQLETFNVTDVEPTSHVHGATNFFRQDIAQEPLSVQEGLKNAPDRSGNFIRVPIIIEQGTEH